jgi:hypothetical protein
MCSMNNPLAEFKFQSSLFISFFNFFQVPVLKKSCRVVRGEHVMSLGE